MTDQEALLAAILQYPGDDTPRLVYADWLDEHDEAERAEFIRVQCELARTTLIYEDGDWQEGGLKLRERELLDGVIRIRGMKAKGSFHWIGDALQKTHVWAKWPHFSRGFVSEIRLSLAAFLEHAAAIFAKQPITTVRIVDREPAYRDGKWFWTHGRQGCNASPFVPAAICEYWPDRWKGNGTSRYRDYNTRESALAALSAACVAYGRKAAGVPQLQPQA